MNGRAWSSRDVATLRRLYADTPTKRIAAVLARPLNTVYAKANGLGLHKSATYLASPHACRLRRGDNVGWAHRFTKGQPAWNKGTHFVAGGRSAETRFKKGQFPANKDAGYYVLGALRVNSDGYIDMRIGFGPGAKGWRGLHSILWADANGPVPKGYAVCFKNGDKLDVELANLELVSRADLMRRNTLHNLPAPLRSTIHALGQLKRRIREKQDRGSAQSPVRNARSAAR